MAELDRAAAEYFQNHALKILLSITSSGPVVRLPTTTALVLVIRPDVRKGTPPFTVTGSAGTCKTSETVLTSSSVAFG